MSAVLRARRVRRTPALCWVLRTGQQSPPWLRTTFCRLLQGLKWGDSSGAHGSANSRSELCDGEAELQVLGWRET